MAGRLYLKQEFFSKFPTHHHLVCELHAFFKDAWLLVTQYSLNYYHPVAITPPAARNVTIYAAVSKTLRDSQQFDDVATVLFSFRHSN